MALPTVSNESIYPMLDVEPALQLVLERASAFALPFESVPLGQHLQGRLLWEDVKATSNHPPFRASIMDGYAVVDLVPGSYPVALTVTAGHGSHTPLQPGQVSYITTGAPVPVGATAVVKIEDTTTTEEGQVNILVASAPGKWIRAIGSDVAQGSVVLPHLTRIGPAEIALLASIGQSAVRCRQRPIVGVMSTGDELVDATSPEEPGSWKIRDSNRPMLLAAARNAGAEALDLGIAPDEKEQLQQHMLKAMQQCDILVTSGGVSMGTHDLVKPLLEELPGSTLHFGRVRMKPGKPTTFAELNDTLFFALPGNPVSSLVAFQLFVEPCVRRLMGCPLAECHHSRVQVRLQRSLPIDPVRREYHRASLEWKEDSPGNGGCGEFHASSTGLQRSSRLLSMITASALLCLPRATGTRRSLPAGSVVPALLLNRHVVPPPSTITQHTYATTPHGVEQTEEQTEEQKAEQHKEPLSSDLEPTCPCCRAAGRSPNAKTSKHPPPPLFGGSSSAGGEQTRVGVLTVSDRAYRGQYEDRGGPEVLRCVAKQIQSIWLSESRVVPDDQREIENTLIDLCDRRNCSMIITTGGTGPSPRDVTPEATVNVCDRMFPGFGERMRAISMRYVPTAMLSRQTAGLRGSCFIINLPGNPGSIAQILPEIMNAIAHCVQLAGGPRMVVVPAAANIASTASTASMASTPVSAVVSAAISASATYTIDGANVQWLEDLMGPRSGATKDGKDSATSATVARRTMSDVVVQLLQHVRAVADQGHVFTKKRGCGRVKSKTTVALALGDELLLYLHRAVKEFDLPDLGKGLRIVLDYAMEEPGVARSIFGE